MLGGPCSIFEAAATAPASCLLVVAGRFSLELRTLTLMVKDRGSLERAKGHGNTVFALGKQDRKPRVKLTCMTLVVVDLQKFGM